MVAIFDTTPRWRWHIQTCYVQLSNWITRQLGSNLLFAWYCTRHNLLRYIFSKVLSLDIWSMCTCLYYVLVCTFYVWIRCYVAINVNCSFAASQHQPFLLRLRRVPPLSTLCSSILSSWFSPLFFFRFFLKKPKHDNHYGGIRTLGFFSSFNR